MEDPADEVVDELRLRERLVAAFMGNDPETCSDQASGKTVKGPEGKAGKGIVGGRGKGNVIRGEERFDICGGFINDTDEEEVPNAMYRCVARQTRSCARRCDAER